MMDLYIKPLAYLDPPLDEAIEALGDCDPWLRRKLDDLLSVGPGFYGVVGLGMAARLWQPGREELRDVTAKQLAGEYDPRVGMAARWGESLTEDEIDTLEDLTIAAIGQCLDGLNDLDSPELSDEFFEAWVVSALHARDDIECVMNVLRAAGREQRCNDMLALVDRVGEQVLADLPDHFGIGDERLGRVWAASPDLWWGRPPDTEENLLALG